MSFPCTQCGQCCKNIKAIEHLSTYHSGNGICYYYSDAKGCSIYEARPDICRIDEGYKKFFSNRLSYREYIQKNADVCNQLQENAAIDLSYRVKIT